MLVEEERINQNIFVVRNKLMGHPHLNILCGLGSFVPPIITLPPSEKKKKKKDALEKMQKKMTSIIQGLHQFPY